MKQQISGQNQYYRVLTIAGSDSSGGAGIQADLKTFAALDCYGMSAITAITAQNTVGVQEIQVIQAQLIRAQIDAVVNDVGIDAVKIGMLANQDIINVVTDFIRGIDIPVIFDPVMVASCGDTLTAATHIDLFKELMAYCTLVTPNLYEACLFTGSEIKSQADMLGAAKTMVDEQGAKAVLIKGGHLPDNILADLLYHNELKMWFKHEKIITKNTHGTGCTLSSAIAANMAKGQELGIAVAVAIDFLQGAITKGQKYSLGKGHGPVHHFYQHEYQD
ncbi:phosphomethylpyrimidine kinase [Piscirickettsia salmonis]|uniref:hydroxymethylpyrimidine kinase n=1 Tax=Piscirickettsia salmonis TaxID=1238 RepID=A0A9Q6LUD4_PISSA|nr:bifunctional hydroxymethylpyrimidine kinase/phosphomethylpyrimidine kinase [Piscirickettsia salmonis]RNC77536.1 bifunctional hydroxymethylpyrimidine kinase/phosphomethylpyrimidine kinase [Piscirickettsiaceae bacterium NZ-RLO2]ALA24273.1 phosphomethylpyrimidine kinase [Piscirickettsia salmonis]APS44656.1 phosphomethylpyrimidine kinase [Piscirickettsia salmonis]APS48016.1 phosphomethylpyrimidine kinase [Piscirickettsia salmonis]APS51973.1 phosphomethylpyrimidine kinase [Piscirickettsia salmon